MRRFLALIAVPLLACLVLAACGGSAKSTASSSSSATSSAGSSPGANTAVTASGAFDKTPMVTIPKATPGNSLTVRTLIQGSGTTLTKSDALAANFVLYFWQGKSSSLKANTFTSSPTVIERDDAARPGEGADRQEGRQPHPRGHPARAGLRHLGESQLGITGSTTLVFVVDMLKSYADTAGATGAQVSNGGGTLPTVSAKSGAAPTVTFPSASPPSALVTKTLVKGEGAKVAKGD